MASVEIDPKMEELFEELVPSTGPAETLGGEIVRAFNRIGYRFLNDGDHIGVYMGNETCNPAARFLVEKVPETEQTIKSMWGCTDDELYSVLIAHLQDIVLDAFEADDGSFEQVTGEDMFDWKHDNDYGHDYVDFDGFYEDEEEDDYYDDEEEGW